MVTYFLRSTRLKIHYSIQTIKQHKYEQPNFVNKWTHPCISCFISATANSFLETNNSKCLWVSEKQYSIFLQSTELKFEQTTSQKHSILRSFLTTYQTQFCNKQRKKKYIFILDLEKKLFIFLIDYIQVTIQQEEEKAILKETKYDLNRYFKTNNQAL